MTTANPPTRRQLLGAAAAAGLLGAAAPAAFPDGATLVVGGPGGSPANAWAEWLSPGLRTGLPPGTTIRKDVVGGADGVTAANQFDALAVPDGGTALLMPGLAALAAMVGDPRARFDAARWVPALAAVTPGLVAGRAPLSASDVPLRIAASGADGPELPAMLALDLLGVRWSPVFGLTEAAAGAALLQGQVDAVCLRGRGVAAQLAALGGAARPLFSFGTVDEAATRQRDPAFPEVPALPELLGSAAGASPLFRAWSAVASASDLDVALVLPQLTPAAAVAVWRRAATVAAASGAVQAQAGLAGVRPLPGQAAAASTAGLADASGQLALRSWMAQRLDYRPG